MKKIYERKGRKWLNEYFDNGEHLVIKLSKINSEENYSVFIDYNDFERVKLYNLSVKSRLLKNGELFYSVCGRFGGLTFLHQFIMYDGDIMNSSKYINNKIVIDHINNNRFDNRKENLRFISQKENIINKTLSAKGYRYNAKHNEYIVRITNKENRRIYLGSYKTEKEADEIYLKACLILGYDKIGNDIHNRVKNNNIKLTEEDYNHRHLSKLIK